MQPGSVGVAEDDRLSGELSRERALAADLGDHGAAIPCDAWHYEATKWQAIAAAVVAGAYGDEYRTADFLRKALTGKIDDELLKKLEASRTSVRKHDYDQLGLDSDIV